MNNKSRFLNIVFAVSILFINLLSICSSKTIYPIDNIQCDTKTDYTRFVANVSGSAICSESGQKREYVNNKEYNYFYLDVAYTTVPYNEKKIPVNDSVLNIIHIINYKDLKVVRFVFYLKPAATYEVYRLSNPARLVVDIKKTLSLSDDSLDNESEEYIESRSSEATNAVNTNQINSKGKKYVVILDPGHGGKSMGAKSKAKVNGKYVFEKDIVLKYCLELQKKINQSPDIVAYVTRYSDEYVSLENRVKFSEKYKGNIFISIHLNASNPRYDRYNAAKGVEIYYIDPYKLDRESKNYMERLENDEDIDLKPRNSNVNLKNILQNLVKENLEKWQKESYNLSDSILDSLKPISPFYSENNRGIKKGPFKVLKNHYMPAILMEVGFITNTNDLKYLTDPDFRNKSVDGIYQGIENYFRSLE